MASVASPPHDDTTTTPQISPADLLENLKAKIKGGQHRVPEPAHEETLITRPPRLKHSEGSHAVEGSSSVSPDGQVRGNATAVLRT